MDKYSLRSKYLPYLRGKKKITKAVVKEFSEAVDSYIILKEKKRK